MHKQGTGSAGDVLADVGAQAAPDREIVLCGWDASSAWGVQVADYGLWAVQRDLDGRPCSWYRSAVLPTLGSTFTPWGKKS